MSDVDRRAEQTAESEEDLSLPAFQTMGQGYKFVFSRLPVFVRLGWLDFVYSAILFVGTGFVRDLLGPRAQTGAFQVVLLPLMGFFVLRFAVRCHRYAYREQRLDDDKVANFDISAENAGPYALLFFICTVLLAAPFALGFASFYLFDLGEAATWPVAAIAFVLDSYMVARMSILFAQTALVGQLPPRRTWGLSKGYVWKLLLIIFLAPWPFNTALKLIAMWQDRLADVWQIPVMLLCGVISFIGVAVIATILSNAFWYCLRGNFELVAEQTRMRGR